MTEESQAPAEPEAPAEVVEEPVSAPEEAGAEADSPPAAEPEAAAIVDKESLHLERHAVARALDAATTTNIGDAAALQARYDELGAQLEALV